MINDIISNMYESLNKLCEEIRDSEVMLSILKPYLKRVMELEEDGPFLKIKFKPYNFIIVKVKGGIDMNEKQFKMIKEWLENDK